jgi:hypothetical protein
LFRWLGRPPEDFLTGPSSTSRATALPAAGPDRRLRFDLAEVHAAVNGQRQDRALTWQQLADELGGTPSRLTGLRTATFADLELTMRVTQWLGRPAADFVRPVPW